MKIKHHRRVVKRAEKAIRKSENGGNWVVFWGMMIFMYAMYLMSNQYSVK
jgi:uncharacterized integral membrane protein